MKKKSQPETAYLLGSENRYEGLIKILRVEPEPFEPPVDDQIEESEEWDLKLLIPYLADMHFGRYLADKGLPSEFTRHLPAEFAMQLPSEYGTRKVSFLPGIMELAKEKGLSDQEQMGVKLARDGLFELWTAKNRAKRGDFEAAAVHIGRAMPKATMLRTVEMEHQWHNGKVYQSETQSDKAKQTRQPGLPEIFKKLAIKKDRDFLKPKELWPYFIEELEQTFGSANEECENKHNPKSWRVFYKGGRKSGITFKRFSDRLREEEKKLLP